MPAHSTAWHRPLPTRPDEGSTASKDTVTCGQYLQAVQSFLQSNECGPLQRALATDRMDTVRIHLEKHGAFYHPCRLRVSVSGRQHTLALNGAVGRAGRQLIDREFEALETAHQRQPDPCTPSVYAKGQVMTAQKQPVKMFLAQWFDDHHEFHLSARDSGRPKMHLWAPTGPIELTSPQCRQLYRQAAAILTRLYDPDTTDQVHGWHHAAGDFVAHIDRRALYLKLISIRGFVPVYQEAIDAHDPAATLVQALWLFLIGMSFRMRLDRLDGTGALAMADEKMIVPILEGFFSVLDGLPEPQRLPAPAGVCLRLLLAGSRRSDLMASAQSLREGWPAKAPEQKMLAAHLSDHAQRLYHHLFANGFLEQYPFNGPSISPP